MYICEDCGHVFARPRSVRQQLALLGEGQPYFEEASLCPRCGGEQLERVAACRGCGESYAAMQLEDGFCPTCGAALLRRFENFLRSLDPDEAEYLRGHIGEAL